MTAVSDVIRATFADWRTVKSRKVLQLVLEVPLDLQGEVLTLLGPPMPDKDTWCAIALLRDPGRTPESRPPASPAHPPANPSEPAVANPRSIAARERYATESEMERARDRAGMLANDPRFHQWSGCNNKLEARAYILRSCVIASRAAIADDVGAYQAFLRMETVYLLDTGQMAAPR